MLVTTIALRHITNYPIGLKATGLPIQDHFFTLLSFHHYRYLHSSFLFIKQELCGYKTLQFSLSLSCLPQAVQASTAVTAEPEDLLQCFQVLFIAPSEAKLS